MFPPGPLRFPRWPAAISNHGDVAGFYTGPGGKTDAFLKTAGGRLTSLAYPGASGTQAFGVNDSDEVVGVYTDGSGNSATMHGFTWTPGGGFSSVDDPQGRGATTINGVNDHGDLTATGLTPGAHAAHIHIGSCMSQGPVQYMLMDFTANSRGQITREVRTVTGVTTPVPATGWYLNLHQGTSNNILANGQPTPNFRPLLRAGF